MKTKDLLSAGVPIESCPETFKLLASLSAKGMSKQQMLTVVRRISQDPDGSTTDDLLAPLSLSIKKNRKLEFAPRSDGGAPFAQWGAHLHDDTSIEQMRSACDLPVAVRGALMPDAHAGYGLPIGGVLATRNAVIPYAVGLDIACRMCLTITDLPLSALASQRERESLKTALALNTRFGIGASFGRPHDHSVLDEDWSYSSVTKGLKDKAYSQLGTSGSGNHFVEWGIVTLSSHCLGLPKRPYVALLSHSGSRGPGYAVAKHFSKIAEEKHKNLPPHLKRLSWLDLDSDAGGEYWWAMNLMGRYASACHHVIHDGVISAAGGLPVARIENHHNFAWKEVHDGEEVVVHRKGATPAGIDDTGIIPGNMADLSYLVTGRGNAEALYSAAHGAGRPFSRTEAKRRFTREEMDDLLMKRGVEVLSADLDESPMAYKPIDDVMAAQDDLVSVIGTFQPKIVKMAPPGEPRED